MILILGGTKMARQLAEYLGQKHQVIYSIAGTTKSAKLPEQCQQFVGGFGGTAGLERYLTSQKINLCIDATHPFAINISRNAIAACQNTDIPIIQYARKKWNVKSATEFETPDQLIKALPENARILLTIGGQNIEPYLGLKQPTIARMIEPPKLIERALPDNFNIILSRPPYALEDEISLMQENKITHLVAKNSGGKKLANKLIAARDLGVKIFLLSQPKSPHIIQLFSQTAINDYLNNLSLVSPS